MIPACLPPREVTRPKVPLPPGACDTHAHVFGPADRFAYADDRSYTPPDAPLEKYLGMLDTLGLARGVLVQGSAHGGHLLELFQAWTPDQATQQRILVTNPEKLYGFSN
jgi:predicted TIM-barrel fold metal-dependent hydrolase